MKIMPNNNDFKRKNDEKSAFASSAVRRTVTAVLCLAVIAAANNAGGDRVRAYTSAFGRALRNNAFGIDSISSVRAAAERLYRLIPSTGGKEGGSSSDSGGGENTGESRNNPTNGITFQ